MFRISGLVFGECSHLPTALDTGAAVSLILVKHLRLRNARIGAVVVAFALVAAACGETTTSTTGAEAPSEASSADQSGGAGAESDPTASVPSDVAVTAAPPQIPSAEPNNDVAVDNYPSFVGTTSDGASFEMASLAGEDVILWFWAPW